MIFTSILILLKKGEICLSKIKFQKLTPTNDVELEAYEEGFDFIFDNDDILNVAISGPYSSGKSSLIESYKEKHKDKCFLHISLAHFSEESIKQETDNVQGNDNDDKYLDDEAVIEGKIINQLAQQISPKNIPLTNFQIKRKSDKNFLWPWSICFTVIILFIWFVFNFEDITNRINSSSLSFFKIFVSPNGILAEFIVFTILVIITIHKILVLQTTKNILKHINIQGNEIEIFSDSNESYFDKYLNEVLYLFENSGANVIVFEDIDRFDSVKIFERLHEINRLVNVRLKKDNDKDTIKTIRFFYLIRDDIFVSKDRTKFFDFILPVVPVMDSSNSYNKIKELFIDNNSNLNLDDRFLNGLSLYIDDLRILKNIFNEFNIYYERLKKINLDLNKLLAIITYKNLFPKDFSDLQLNSGFVYLIFSKKEEYYKTSIENINKDISKYESEIETIQNERLINIEELDFVKIKREENAKKKGNTNRNPEWVKYQEWEKNEYPVRKKILENDKTELIADIENKISKLKIEKDRIEGKSLANLITRDNIDDIFKACSKNTLDELTDYNDIKRNQYFNLLKFLIRNGYIDESYNDYMSYFYENSVTLNDKDFLCSINDKKAKKYEFKLDSPQLVLSNLSALDFLQEETMNFSLLDYLLSTSKENEKYLKSFSDQMREERRFDFLSKYFDLNKHRPEFVIWLNNSWPKFFAIALNEQQLTRTQLLFYSLCSVSYCDEKTLVLMNDNSILSQFISQQSDFLKKTEYEKKQLIEMLQKLGVQFKNLKISNDNKLLEQVYKNDLYEINNDNIEFFLSFKYCIDLNTVSSHILSIISELENEPIYTYLFNNLDLTVTEAIDISNNKIDDDIDTVNMILNSDLVNEGNKNTYVSLLTTVLPQISTIKDNICLDMLLKYRKVEPSADNIIEYYSRQGLTDILKEFINNTLNCIDFDNYSDDEIAKKFGGEVIYNNEFSDLQYEVIVKTLCKEIIDLKNTTLEHNKILILVNTRLLVMNLKNLNFVRNNYKDILFDFIKCNLHEYCRLISSTTMVLQETLKVIQFKEIDLDDAKKIIDFIKSPMSCREFVGIDEVLSYILNNKFDQNDFEYLISHYSSYSQKIKNDIIKIVDTRINDLVNNIKLSDFNLVKDALKSIQISAMNKKSLLMAVIKDLTYVQIIEALNVSGNTQIALKLFNPRKKPNINISNDNKDILQALKERGLITSFKINKNNYYSIYMTK